MPSIGAPELIIVLVLALLILGPRRLPDAGRALGSSLRNFKTAVKGGDEDIEDADEQLALSSEAPVVEA